MSFSGCGFFLWFTWPHVLNNFGLCCSVIEQILHNLLHWPTSAQLHFTQTSYTLSKLIRPHLFLVLKSEKCSISANMLYNRNGTFYCLYRPACLCSTVIRICFCVCVKELTEEGIPFLILFHQKDDTDSLEKFQQEVARQLISEKGMHRDQKGSWAGQCLIILIKLLIKTINKSHS